MSRHIIICPGHHPAAVGATWEGSSNLIKEHDKTDEWVRRIMDRAGGSGIHITMVHGMPLREKVNRVNEISLTVQRDAIAVDLHFNAAGRTYVEGCETLYYPGSDRGHVAAEVFQTTFMARANGLAGRDRGVKEGWYKQDHPHRVDYDGDVEGDEVPDYFLKATNCPSLILEPLFLCQFDGMTSEVEDKLIESCYSALTEVASRV